MWLECFCNILRNQFVEMILDKLLEQKDPHTQKNVTFKSSIHLTTVHFHWIFNGEQEELDKKELIDLEYQLRPRITRFIMDRIGFDCCEDYSCFHFDIDLDRREVRISDKTPEKYTTVLSVEFAREIGVNCC